MLEAITGLDPLLKTIGALAVAVAALASFARWVLPKYRNAKSDARAIRDTLVGREAQRDSITGEEIQPAIPGIGSRMADQERHARGMQHQMTTLTNAVADMASNQRRIDDLEQRVTAIEQGHHLERLAGKAENIRLYGALEAIANGDDPTDPDDAA